MELTAVFYAVPDGYLGVIAELPLVTLRGSTLEETRTRLSQTVSLLFESHHALLTELNRGNVVSRERLPVADTVAEPGEPRLNQAAIALLWEWRTAQDVADADDTLPVLRAALPDDFPEPVAPADELHR